MIDEQFIFYLSIKKKYPKTHWKNWQNSWIRTSKQEKIQMTITASYGRLDNIFNNHIENLATPCVGKLMEQWQFSYTTGFYIHFDTILKNWNYLRRLKICTLNEQTILFLEELQEAHQDRCIEMLIAALFIIVLN